MYAVRRVGLYYWSEDNRDRHGMTGAKIDDPQPHDTMGDMEMDIHNAPKNGSLGRLMSEKNNFSQYGGWVVQGYKGRHSMYTREREGMGRDALAEGQKKDSQAANCSQHILFGHGPQIHDVTCSCNLVQNQRVQICPQPRN